MNGTLRVVTPPSAYPVTRVEAKAHCRIDTSDDDAMIDGYVAAATQWAEEFCNRKFCQQQVRLTLDAFPCGPLELRGGQVQSVESVQYYDSQDALQTWTSSEYIADLQAEPARIEPALGYTYPYARSRVGAVQVNYTVGYASTGSPSDYAANVPDPVKTAIKLWIEAQYDRDKDQMMDLTKLAETLLWPYRLLGY